MGAAEAEIGHIAPGRGIDQPCRFGRDQGGDADRTQQSRLQEERLAEGRGHTQQRFVGEGDGSFGHGQDLAGEAEAAQLVQECRIVGLDAGEVGEILVRVLEVAHEVERRRQARREQIGPAERRRAGVEIERRRGVLPRARQLTYAASR